MGLALQGVGLSMKDMIELARVAEDTGFEQVYSVEVWREVFGPLVAMALGTKRIKLGTGIMNIYLRSPLLGAQMIAELDELSEGRALLGLGSSIPDLVEPHGLNYVKPLTRMKEYVEILKRLLRGEVVSHQGEAFNLKGTRLLFKPLRSDVPMYLAALGPKMHQLAGEMADGVITDICTDPEYVKYAIENLKDGCRRAGRDLSKIDLACNILCSVSDSEKQAMKAMKPNLAFYIMEQPGFRPIFRRLGVEETAFKVCEAVRAGDMPKAIQLLPDRMVESLTVTGTPEQCRARLEDYAKAGVQTPVLVPVGEDQKAGIIAAIRAFSS